MATCWIPSDRPAARRTLRDPARSAAIEPRVQRGIIRSSTLEEEKNSPYE